MNEDELENAIKAYTDQLSQINKMIPNSEETAKLELLDLKKDLLELMQVTEESLLSLKKSKLLSLLSSADSSTSKPPFKVAATCASPSQNVATEAVPQHTDGDFDHNSFVGVKCRIKYTEEWGTFQYHNAMVLGVENSADDMDFESPNQVRVVFLNPTHLSMVMCPYYLDGNCDFGESRCRYSHGFLVDIDELEEFLEPDFSILKPGSLCLAKQEENGVWCKATVLEVHEDTATVKGHAHNAETTVSLGSLLPLDKDVVTSSSDEESLKDGIAGEVSDVGYLSYKSTSMSGPLGEWEVHTTGFGSRMMLKMGYIFGKGLGRNSDGRVEPVEISLLPPGKSLDAVAELREKGKVKKPFARKRRRIVGHASAIDQSAMDPEKASGSAQAAFDLINRLSGLQSKVTVPAGNPELCATFSVEESYQRIKQDRYQRTVGDVRKGSSVDKKVNVDLLKVTEKISSMEKHIGKLKEAALRNRGDGAVMRTISDKLACAEIDLTELRKCELSLQQKLKQTRQSNKLTVF